MQSEAKSLIHTLAVALPSHPPVMQSEAGRTEGPPGVVYPRAAQRGLPQSFVELHLGCPPFKRTNFSLRDITSAAQQGLIADLFRGNFHRFPFRLRSGQAFVAFSMTTQSFAADEDDNARESNGVTPTSTRTATARLASELPERE